MFNTCTLICVLKASVVSSSLLEENFHWNLNFAIEKFNFSKFKFHFLLHFQKSLNDPAYRLYD